MSPNLLGVTTMSDELSDELSVDPSVAQPAEVRTPIRRRALLAAPLAAVPLVIGWPLADSAVAGTRTVPLPRPGSHPVDVHAPKHDFRALWIASVVNIDWPSKPGLSVADQQAELLAWFDLAVAQHHNAVVLQVRPTADAFWPSPYEPWSVYLTGEQGRYPGYDPLGFAVAEAHRRNLALHAWFNPYRVSMGDDPSVLVPDHPARLHPEWVIGYGGKLYYDPGLPAVREFVIDAIMDAVDRYDLDAVHFDDYFYPYPVVGETFDDAATFARYGRGFDDVADWRRDNINRLVTGLQRRIKKAKRWVQLGISPFAIWRNVATDPRGSDTTAGAETYDDLYADTRRWVRDGWIDYIAPQVYWSRGFTAADYEKVTRWWTEQIDASRRRGHHVGLYVGQATYKVALNADPSWDDPAELSSHLEFYASFDPVDPQVVGNIYFSAKDVRADRLGASSLLTRTWYGHPALLPVVGDAAYERGRNRPPRPVSEARVAGGRFRWTSRDRDAVGFAVYRISGRVDSADLADASHLIHTQRRTATRTQTWTDPTPTRGTTYVITAVDREGRESDGVIAR